MPKYTLEKKETNEKQGNMKRYRRKSASFLMGKNKKILPTNRRKKGIIYDKECGWNFVRTLIKYEL